MGVASFVGTGTLDGAMESLDSISTNFREGAKLLKNVPLGASSWSCRGLELIGWNSIVAIRNNGRSAKVQISIVRIDCRNRLSESVVRKNGCLLGSISTKFREGAKLLKNVPSGASSWSCRELESIGWNSIVGIRNNGRSAKVRLDGR